MANHDAISSSITMSSRNLALPIVGVNRYPVPVRRHLLLALPALSTLGCLGVFNPTLDDADSETAEDSSEGPETGDTVDTSDTADTDDTGPSSCAPGQTEVADGCMALLMVIANGQTPTDLALADLSGDGILDLVIADDGGEADFHLGSGVTFGGPVPIAGANSFGLAVGEINGVSPLDLAAVGYDQVTLLESVGAGQFGMTDTLPAQSGWDAVFGNIDGDDDDDLIVSDPGGPALRVWKRDAGTYTPQPDLTTGGDAQGVVLADVDDDGDLDLALADTGSNQVRVYPNDGQGSFGAPAQFSVSLVWDVAAADIDDDGTIELLAVDSNDGNVAVLDVTANFTIELQSNHAVGQGPHRIAVGDVDGDGYRDAVTANFVSGDASILLNVGTGLTDEIRLPALPELVEADSVAVGDLDGDGRDEIVIGAYGSGSVSVFVHTR
jgi:hypothetical protein